MKNGTKIIIGIAVAGVAVGAFIYWQKTKQPTVDTELVDWLAYTAVVTVNGRRYNLDNGNTLYGFNGYTVEWKNDQIALKDKNGNIVKVIASKSA